MIEKGIIGTDGKGRTGFVGLQKQKQNEVLNKTRSSSN